MAPRKSSSRAASRTPAAKNKKNTTTTAAASPRATSASAGRKSAAAAVVAENAPEPVQVIEQARGLVRSISMGRDEAFSSLNPTCNEIVPPTALRNLKNYSYKTIDNSIVLKYGKIGVWWDFCVNLVPYWVAPNMLTLLACFCSLSYPFLVMYLEGGQPEADSSKVIPAWVWFFSAVALFAYQTLDAIDGKQARRTKAGSALGELFDHGLDMLFTPFMLYASCRCMNMSAYQTFSFILLSTFTGYSMILEQFLSGIFVLPPISGPTEGILISLGLYLFTFFKGGSAWWLTPIKSGALEFAFPKTLVAAFDTSFTKLPAKFVIANTYADVAFVIFMALAFITCVQNCRSIYFLLGRKNDVIKNFATCTAVVGSWSLFAVLFPELAYNNVRGFSLTFGLFFSFSATDLTVHRLVELPARISCKMVLLAVGFPLLKMLIFRSPARSPACFNLDASSICRCLATDLALVTFGSYVFYLISIYYQFARGLGINVVTMTENQVRVAEAEMFKRSREQKK